jgi:taurine transport system ATP-binding protein
MRSVKRSKDKVDLAASLHASPTGMDIGITDVRHEYQVTDSGPVIALDNVTMKIDSGELVCVIGPSGCGKTTLLRLIAGFEYPTQGVVSLGDSPIAGPGADRGVVGQSAALYPWMSIEANVGLGPTSRGVAPELRKRAVSDALALVGLTDFAQRRPYELSGGMQQRAAIARVLANDSPIMLLDEPFGALDAITRERLQSEVVSLWRKTGKTILLITHSIDEAIYMGCRVIVMSPRPGRIVREIQTRDCDDRDGPAFIKVRREIRELIFSDWGE